MHHAEAGFHRDQPQVAEEHPQAHAPDQTARAHLGQADFFRTDIDVDVVAQGAIFVGHVQQRVLDLHMAAPGIAGLHRAGEGVGLAQECRGER
ncbi:hypothetical protein D3C85_1324630 [compost metagenome]